MATLLRLIAGKPTNKSQDVETQTVNSDDELLRYKNRCKELEERLSKMASERMRDDNPTVEDLSDPRRPTALVSRWTSLFRCGEYWAAYDKIASEKGEPAATSTLHEICLVTYKTVKVYVEDLIRALAASLDQPSNVPPPTSASNNHTEMVSEDSSPPQVTSDGSEVTPVLQDDGSFSLLSSSRSTQIAASQNLVDFLPDENELRGILSALKSLCSSCDGKRDKHVVSLLRSKRVPDSLRKQVHNALQKAEVSVERVGNFVDQLLELVYYMRLQEIPLVVDCECQEGSTFNPLLYESENAQKKWEPKSTVVRAILCPAVLRHEEGPVLCKGEVEVMPRNPR